MDMDTEDSTNIGEDETHINSPDALAHIKRKSKAGSRGVANLTPEQLAKKRANGKGSARHIAWFFI